MAFFLVMTSATGVTDPVAASVHQQLSGAGTPRRLAETAVEIQLPEIQSVTAPDGIDVNVVPAANRRKSLLIADMDSTIIPVECIDELADFAGRKSEVSAITERAMRGELDFEEALHSRVATLKGVTRAQIEQCRRERVSLNPGARTLVSTMNALGAFTALVSGGFTVFTGPVSQEAGFQMNRANQLLFDSDVLSGKVAIPICGADTKLETLESLLREHDLTGDDVIAVGDGANDAPMIGRAGLGVAYKARPVLRRIAKAQLDHSDLTALLSLQGITSAQYAD